MSQESIFSFPLRVYYEDTDAGGIVYHANYLRFMERARTEFLLLNDYILNSDYGFIVRDVELEYLRPARLYALLEVTVQILKNSGTSLTFEQIVRSKENKDFIFCRGTVTLVYIRADTMSPCRLPEKLRIKNHK